MNTTKHDDLPDWNLRDIYSLAEADAGIPILLTGAKRADSLWRKRFLANTKDQTDMVYPIVGWTKLDVIAYLKSRRIPLPASSGASATGIDLSPPSLFWLHSTYFKRLCEVFPFAEGIIWRKKWYGA